MRRVLVTGGSGFIGSHLVRRLLAEGYVVTVVGRRPPPGGMHASIRFFQADLRDQDILRQSCRDQDVVFHTAARVGTWGAHRDYYIENVLATQAILDGCRWYGVRGLVFTSTPSVVYSGGHLRGVDEAEPYLGTCPSDYPVTKAEAERRVLKANSEKLHTVALRPHLVWGPGDRNLYPRLCRKAQDGSLRRIGPGTNKVDLTYIDNCVEAHVLAGRAVGETGGGPVAAAGKAYFITNGEPVELWPFLDRLLELRQLGPVRGSVPAAVAMAGARLTEMKWRLLRRRGEPPINRFVVRELATDHWFSIEAARRDLGYEPKVTMEQGLEGLRRAVASVPPWMLEEFEGYVPTEWEMEARRSGGGGRG